MKNLIKPFILISVLISSSLLSSAKTMPITQVPSGFGHYCSVTISEWRWALLAYSPANSDPCKDLRGGKIQACGFVVDLKKQ